MSPRWTARGRVVYTPLDDHEAVLLDLDTMTYFSLNETAMCIWLALAARPRTARELVDELVSAFEVSTDHAEADVDGFLVSMSREALVVELR